MIKQFFHRLSLQDYIFRFITNFKIRLNMYHIKISSDNLQCKRMKGADIGFVYDLSLIHISEPTRLGMISYAVFCLKKKKKKKKKNKNISIIKKIKKKNIYTKKKK